MILVSGGIKGGCGKSTIAVNLAVIRANAGYDVLLIDADEQGTSTDFASMRSERLPDEKNLTSIALTGKAVRNEVLKLIDKYDDIVIDTGGRDTASQRAAMSVTDYYLVPFTPRAPDIWTLEELENLVEEMAQANPKMKAISFLNRTDHVGKDNDEASNHLSESETIQFLPIRIGNRKVFGNALGLGLSVAEYEAKDESTKKAVAEIQELYKAIFK